MNKLNLIGKVFDSSGFPVKSGTWEFLQNANKEALNALARSIIGDEYSASVTYILFGCKASPSALNNTFSEGAIFFNGEVYYSPTQTVVLPSGGDNVYARLKTTQYGTDADPVLFTDGVSKNVHDIRRVEYYNASSSTGATFGIFSGFENLNKWKSSSATPTITSPTAGFSVSSTTLVYSRWKVVNNVCFWNFDANADFTCPPGTIQLTINYPSGFPVPNSLGSVFFGTYNNQLIMITVGFSSVTLSLMGTGLGTIVEAGQDFGSGIASIRFSISLEVIY